LIDVNKPDEEKPKDEVDQTPAEEHKKEPREKPQPAPEIPPEKTPPKEHKGEISEEPEKGKPKTQKEEKKEDFRYIVRIANADIDGNKNVLYGLTQIKGIGRHMSVLVVDAAGLDGKLKVGNLTDAQIDKIKEVLANLSTIAPPWMLNHRMDYDTGKGALCTKSSPCLINELVRRKGSPGLRPPSAQLGNISISLNLDAGGGTITGAVELDITETNQLEATYYWWVK
jgi:ribosomal protein S13